MADSNRSGSGQEASLEVRRALAIREKRIRDLEGRLEQEMRLSQRALEETLKARQERDEYRRVLAASLAEERRARLDLVAQAEEEETLRARLDRALEERGISVAQAEGLEVRLEQQSSEHHASLRRAEEKTWGLSEEHGHAMRLAVEERSIALGRLEELQRTIGPPIPDSLKATRGRAWINLGIAALLAVLALIILPGALLAVFSDDGALHMGVLVGFSPAELVFLELILCACTMVLGSWGIHELRGVERRAEEQASVRSGDTGTQVGIESQG